MPTNREFNIKLEACPIKRKNCSLEAWLSEVELWDSSNNTGDPERLNTKKYLALMESIRNSEDKDLERTAEVEFIENQEFDKKVMMDKLKEKLGESDVEKCSAVWKEFVNIKQEGIEATKDYVARYEQTEMKMKNVNMKMPNRVLAIHMMMKSNMETQSKENILTKTNLTNDEQIYTSMKKLMKEMKKQHYCRRQR